MELKSSIAPVMWVTIVLNLHAEGLLVIVSAQSGGEAVMGVMVFI